MNDEIVKLLADRHFSKVESLPDWAIRCLEQGHDSKSLRILPSMSKWDSASELDTYFQRALKELGWDKIDRPDYLMRYAEILAGEILGDKTEPIKTGLKIYEICQALDYPAELYDFIEINEMIWDYEYFLKTGSAGHFYRPKEELIDEIKRISQELLKSKERI
jgi:hypothetical protein